MALFENYEGRMPQLQPVLEKYGFKDFDELKAYNNGKGVDAYKIVEGIQPICFENAKWAYELGAAIALKKGVKTAAEAATCIGEGLQAFCIPGSVADSVRLVWATAIWARCCWTRRPSASRSSLATNPSQLLRVQSVSLRRPTRSARTSSVSS